MSIDKLVARMWREVDNDLFLSKEEENTIEHVDNTYSGFRDMIQNMMYEAYEFGKSEGYDDGYRDGGRDESENHECEECDLEHV